MTLDRAAGSLLIGLPIAFNAFFFLLGRLFDYPAVLRSPVGEVLSRFHAGGLRLKLIWYGFMLTAVLLAPLAVLLGQVLARDELEIVPVATTIGVLAAVVQFLGRVKPNETTLKDRLNTLDPKPVRQLETPHLFSSNSSSSHNASPVALSSIVGISE